ncbi:MAG: Coenzyme F420 hydrogenase/dehydrogenase, beta subunit C-terminal domain, partial [Lachnospiraceae bacterium]|nr:Coenzyme F420 hydrogenase/dehydrogenase, beta subunit C-terminal domain [Lachnospiraceae bacterium]
IEMKNDVEGFDYPHVNSTLCINCGLCKKICPVNNMPKLNNVLEGYVCRYKDLDVVNNSTSGGTCSAFADYTFERNGLIYGVGYDSKMKVRHFCIDKTERNRIIEMSGSKYVQSDLNNSFTEIKKVLKNGKFVCFSGTPCQVAGLKNYLGEDYDNLVTVDLVCHGVSSPLVFKKYIEYQEQKNKSKVIDARFRNKTYGYHSGTMMLMFENGKKYYGSGRIDHMLKAYFSGACSRNSCYKCPFKGIDRCSDITVFDSWHIEQLVNGQKDDDKGYTNVLVHTEKGRKILSKMKLFLPGWEADPALMKQLDGIMIDNNPERAECRQVLIGEIIKNGFFVSMQKYLPITSKDHLIEKGKIVAHKTGLLRRIKVRK